jgi:preprotein translocase subunit YajC
VPLLIVLVLGLAVMYVVMIRPQRRRQAQHQTLIDALGVGEDVLTTGGIYGTVTQVEEDDLVVEIADGVAVHMTRRGIAAVLPLEDGEDEDEDFEDDDDEDLSSVELDEAAVAGKEEEIVTSAVDQDSRSGDRR